MNLPHAAEIAASAPPVSVAGMTWFGYAPADWVQVLAGIWLVLQIGYFIWSKFIRKDKPKE
jgi:uncharacterized membrane protein YfcA